MSVLLTTADILTRVGDTLQDVASVRWTSAERKRYLLDGMVLAVDRLPGHGATTYATFALAVGVEQQFVTDPSGTRMVSRIMDVIQNRTGSVVGKTIRRIAKDQLDTQRPYWMTEAPAVTIMYWMPSESEPRTFLVYPPAAAGASVRAKVSMIPNNADNLEVDDALRDALYHYVVARCWAKDATYAQTSDAHMLEFNKEIERLLGADKLADGRTQERQTTQ